MYYLQGLIDNRLPQFFPNQIHGTPLKKKTHLDKYTKRHKYQLICATPYRSPERQVREKDSGDPFSKFDLNCFPACAYDLRPGEKVLPG